MSGWAGLTAIVTGAAHGLGRVIALEYAAEGATVALLDLDPAKLAETTAEIEAAGETVDGPMTGQALAALVGEEMKTPKSVVDRISQVVSDFLKKGK